MSPFRVALTGGIASGKSTVANLFAARGVPVIDTDLIARQVVEPGEPALAAVLEAFGPAVLGADGRLNRPRMRERVFSDPAARRRLEAILHPAIRAEMERQSRAAGGPYQLLVIPLLVEGGRRGHVDRVLVVDVPEATQIERLMRRDGVSREQAAAALGAQATRDARLAFADDVIENAADLAALEARVDEIHRDYLRRTTA
jgi:dephospho-CoA kinase